MPQDRLTALLSTELAALSERGTSKRDETVVAGTVPPAGGRGPRVLLEGEGTRSYLKMNSNSYLGLSQRPELAHAEDEALKTFGTGPGAVRFISGTVEPHVRLEERLARFHGRESAMIFSSAYAAVVSVLVPLITGDTAIVSDELNHNCIIRAMQLSRPQSKEVYKHLDLRGLADKLTSVAGKAKRAVVITDGIFSMRGDHAPLDEIFAIARRFDSQFPENVLVVVDDSHGVGAFGATGRGTEEHVGSGPADILVGTLGKAFGVNGGYVTCNRTIRDYLRETSPMYIYSNPITPGEAAAALAALEILDGAEGRKLLEHLRAMTVKLQEGLANLGLETIPGAHPVVPLLVRDTSRTRALVAHLRSHSILATGLAFPVVPRGEDEIRFQVNASHTEADIDEVLTALRSFPAAH
jgi:glycine C-acetyltransferase